MFRDQRREMPWKTPERAGEWVRKRAQSQENRMMSVQQTDALQCLSRRFNARESLSRILLLSRTAKSSFFPLNIFFLYVMLFVMLHFLRYVDILWTAVIQAGICFSNTFTAPQQSRRTRQDSCGGAEVLSFSAKLDL